MQRVVLGCESAFTRLELSLATQLLPAIFGCEVSAEERKGAYSLPAHFGRLGTIIDPVSVYVS